MSFTIRERCGHCRQVADLSFVSTLQFYERNPNPPRRNPDPYQSHMSVRVLDDGDTVDAYAVAICPLCAKPSLVLYQTKRKTLPNIKEALGDGPGLFGGSSVIKVGSVYPTPPQPDDHASWPQKAAELFRDAQLMLEEGRSPSIIISTCRSILWS